jgi:folate-dependent phosphoribosylglycinamide formyltransferase PurN
VKIFILSSPILSDFQLKVLAPLFESDKIDIVGVCINDTKPKSNIERLKGGWGKGRGVYILIMALDEILRKYADDSSILASKYFNNKNVPIHLIKDLNCEESIEFIKNKKPDSIFQTGFGLIREPLLSLEPRGVISYHHGNIRKYRGCPVAFWELFHNEVEMSVTVQILNEGLDSGKIVKEIQIPIYKNDSWKSLQKRAYEKSTKMIYEACLLLDSDDFEPVVLKKRELGDLYTLPNYCQWLTLQSKVFWRKFTWQLFKS